MNKKIKEYVSENLAECIDRFFRRHYPDGPKKFWHDDDYKNNICHKIRKDPKLHEHVVNELLKIGIEEFKFHNDGSQSIVLDTGKNQVVLITIPADGKEFNQERANEPEILQPIHRTISDKICIEVLPKIQSFVELELPANIAEKHCKDLTASLIKKKLWLWDTSHTNMGLLSDGTPVVIDGRAVGSVDRMYGGSRVYEKGKDNQQPDVVWEGKQQELYPQMVLVSYKKKPQHTMLDGRLSGFHNAAAKEYAEALYIKDYPMGKNTDHGYEHYINEITKTVLNNPGLLETAKQDYILKLQKRKIISVHSDDKAREMN